MIITIRNKCVHVKKIPSLSIPISFKYLIQKKKNPTISSITFNIYKCSLTLLLETSGHPTALATPSVLKRQHAIGKI